MKSVFDRAMAWFLYFFIGSIQFTNDWFLVFQAGREVKSVKGYSICSSCVGSKLIPVEYFLTTPEQNSVGTKTDVYLIW